ncbi:MAG: hypothetical protein K6A43_07625 [Treponema sp.]|nr:hypothetical protein [Treponema sp.]
MQKLKITWQKIVATVLGLLGIGTLTSCYGVIDPFDHTIVSGQVYGDIDNNPKTPDEPIPNIKVCVNDEEVTRTYSDGSFTTDLIDAGIYKLSFEDDDGTENGEFKKSIRAINTKDLQYHERNLGQIILEKK